ncbi:MAG TPA: acyltransferase family protein [Acidimicrobiia bacterium]
MAIGRRYEPGLDGLRGIAVAAVLAYHDERLAGGFLGVSTFFVLSGFLITALLLRERSERGTVTFRNFYSRRVRRLVPAAILGVLLAAVVTQARHDAAAAHAFRADAITALADVANWRFVLAGRSYLALFVTPSAVQHYWSLAVEVQFYVVLVPVIVAALVLGRGRPTLLYVTLTVLTAASVAIGTYFAAHGSFDRAYYGTDTRAAEFLVGALFGALFAARPRDLSTRAKRTIAIAGPFALVGAVAFYVHARLDTNLFRGPLLAFAVLNGVVALAACVPGPVRTALSVSPLVGLGRISYGVYVYHWPLYLLLDHQRTGLGPLALIGVRLGATIAVAIASYVLIEQPIRTGRFIRGRVRWIALPAGLLVASVAASAVAATTTAPVIDFAPAAPLAIPPAPRRNPAPSASRDSPQRVLIVGDSVALTLGRGIERWGAAHGMQVENEGQLGCGLLNGAEVRGYWGVETRNADPCRQVPLWQQRIATFRPDVVVVLFGAWDVYDASWNGGHTWFAPGTPTWDAHYEPAVAATDAILSASGARVLWLEPPCFADTSPTDTSPPPWYSPSRVAVVGSIEQEVSARDGEFATDAVHQSGCPVNLTMRPDGVHYSDPGADRVAPAVGDAILHAWTAKRRAA